MTDLILGRDWLRTVHHIPGHRFGAGGIEHQTIVGSLERRARATPGAPFLSEVGPSARTVTYAQADRTVRQRASFLVASGLRRGDRVGVLAQSSTDLPLFVLAILEAGGVVVLLSPDDPTQRIGFQLRFSEVRFLLFDASYTGIAASCATRERLWSFDDIKQGSEKVDFAARRVPASTDAALIAFTSGTTAAPKAVVQSHYAVASNAWMLVQHHHILPGSRLLCVLPMHHVNGLEFTIFATMLGSGQVFVSSGFDPMTFWPTVRENRIHIVSLVPNLLRLIASRPQLRGVGPLELRYAVSAAAPLPVSVSRQVWERLRLRIVQGYGLSEGTNFSCCLPTDLVFADYERWMLAGGRSSVGPSLLGQEVEVHDGTRFSALGEEGELVVRGPCVMSGYLHNQSATDEAFRDGWLHSGDLGYWLPDESGRKYIHITGRTREIAKRSGVLVSLLEVDEVLASTPGVADAACAAFSNTWVGEEVAAVVVQEPGWQLREEGVIEACRQHLPYSAIPKRIEFVDTVPRTKTGKVRRQEIAGRFSKYCERLFVDPTTGRRVFGGPEERNG